MLISHSFKCKDIVGRPFWLARICSLSCPGNFFPKLDDMEAPSPQQDFLLSNRPYMENKSGSGGLTLSESCF